MIDFALEAENKQHLSPRDAIHQACLLRFRPILMTTMAALLGALLFAFFDAMQLRLQQTVEGLSVAAISYYVVGLIGYLTKAISHDVLPVDPAVVTGLSVPLAVLGVWWVVRRIRRSHAEGGH